MQAERERIDDQLARALDGEAWVGPSLEAILEGVSGEQAAARPIAGAHTIEELVGHMTAWVEIAARRLQGEPHGAIAPEEDWPVGGAPDPGHWHASLERFRRARVRLRELLADFPPARLDEPVAGSADSFYVLLHGVLQHDFYHAGQIVLLKKLWQGSRGDA